MTVAIAARGFLARNTILIPVLRPEGRVVQGCARDDSCPSITVEFGFMPKRTLQASADAANR
jgi:hypothetical protein